LIITYELTILFGILATVIGFFISARLPVIKERVYYGTPTEIILPNLGSMCALVP
jgi:hypothetical protein